MYFECHVRRISVFNDWTLNRFTSKRRMLIGALSDVLSAIPSTFVVSVSDSQLRTSISHTSPFDSNCQLYILLNMLRWYTILPPLNLTSQWLPKLPLTNHPAIAGTKPNSRASPSSHRVSPPPSVLSPSPCPTSITYVPLQLRSLLWYNNTDQSCVLRADRYSSQRAMSWPSKRLRKSGPTSTISHGRDEWLYMAAVHTPPTLPSSLNPLSPLLTLLQPSSNALTTVPQKTAIFGPAATTWFAFLARRINFPTRPNLTIAARVLTDQTVFASTNLFCYLSSMAIMEGTDPKEKLRSTYFEALKKNWMVWPAVQAVNFKFVPLEHRVLVVNVVSLGEWGCIS